MKRKIESVSICCIFSAEPDVFFFCYVHNFLFILPSVQNTHTHLPTDTTVYLFRAKQEEKDQPLFRSI